MDAEATLLDCSCHCITAQTLSKKVPSAKLGFKLNHIDPTTK
jgi:hypothetical protein